MNIILKIEKYIADPYRISRFNLIEIQKQSGLNRARSEKKRRECLESHLRQIGMTFEQYETLERTANEPFYKNEDGYIYIPKDSVFACLVNANDEAPSKLRINNLRNALRISDFVTDKKEPDGKWERFAVVKSGTGKSLSNQRGIRVNSYIEDTKVKGVIEHDPEKVKPQSIIDLLDFAGREVGIGASRKMGYGRFSVEVID